MPPKTMTESNYKIGGMTCEGCVAALEKAMVNALSGTRLEVNLEEGWLRIEGVHDPKLVEDTVEAAGFDFEGRIGD